jgi:hypothetical protein
MHDGQFKRFSISDDVEIGMVVREIHDDATVPPFGDSVVLKRVRKDPPFKGDKASVSFLIARPYVFASGIGTTCPTPLTGVETIEISFTNLSDRYVCVLNSRGNPFTYTT